MFLYVLAFSRTFTLVCEEHLTTLFIEVNYDVAKCSASNHKSVYLIHNFKLYW